MPPTDALPTAAVVVATRDRPDQLRRALRSVEEAAPAGTPVTVVDSASKSDATRSVALDAGVRYLRADRPGISRARNLGAASVDAEVVVFTDDDCRPRPGWLEALVEPFTDQAIAFVTGVVVGAGAGTAADVVGLGPVRWTWPDDPAGMGSGANMAVRRDVLLDHGGFDLRFGGGGCIPSGEEQELFLRLLHAGFHGRHAPASSVEHHDLRGRWATVRLFFDYGIGSAAICARAHHLDRRVARKMFVSRLWHNGVRSVAADLRRGWEIPAARGAAMTLGVVVGSIRVLVYGLDQPPPSASVKR